MDQERTRVSLRWIPRGDRSQHQQWYERMTQYVSHRTRSSTYLPDLYTVGSE